MPCAAAGGEAPLDQLKTTLFIPTLNEIDGIKVIMPQIKREWVDEIIFVDCKSTDGTPEWLREHGYRVITQQSRGLALAYWECFDAMSGDVIIVFTPDGNSIPETIPALVAKIKEGYDLVIASRYLGDAKSEDDDVITGFGNWMFTRLMNLLYGTRYTDVLVSYRAFRMSLVKTLNLTRSQHPFLEQELMVRAYRQGFRVTEIPADEPKRIGGVRKMKIVYNGLAVLVGILRELFVCRVKKPGAG
jgi:glycosyltransferase involved in cell wall biosynthesis